jgi:hypothetical protein
MRADWNAAGAECLQALRVYGKQRAQLGKRKRETNDVLSTSTLGAGSGPGHIEVLANAEAAETWFEESDPEGVAFAI